MPKANKTKKTHRPMPTDPKDLARAMFRGVERKIEAWKDRNPKTTNPPKD